MRAPAILLFSLLSLPAGALGADVDADEWARARSLDVGASTTFADLPLGSARSGPVRMQRIDIYAADAKILLAGPDGLHELPRSDWLHFIADASVPVTSTWCPLCCESSDSRPSRI